MKYNIDDVGLTAFLIAQWRSEETESSSPLYYDHIANIFLSDKSRDTATNINGISPSTKYLVNYRTKYFDDSFTAHINKGFKQIVILGAGLDTRSIRLGAEDVRIYEIDKSEVLSFKNEKLESHGYKVKSIFVPGNYIASDFISSLKERGFDCSEKTYFIWEGNTMYLKVDDIISLLEIIKKNVPCFEISFDYLSGKLINRATKNIKAENVVDAFSDLNAQWVTGFDKISTLAEKVHLSVVEDFMITDLIKKNQPDQKTDLSLFDNYSICTLCEG